MEGVVCVRQRREDNLKELEFAVRFSSFEDSPSVYLFWVIVRGKGNLYVCFLRVHSRPQTIQLFPIHNYYNAVQFQAMIHLLIW